MTIAEDLWLRGRAAQQTMFHVTSYSTAFAGTAAIQALHLGLMAPQCFWSAMGRAAGTGTEGAGQARPAGSSTVVPLNAATPVAGAAAPVAPAPAPAAAVETAVETAQDAVPRTGGQSPRLLDAPRGGAPDDLTALTGIGAKLASALNEVGIFHYDQIAALDEDGIAWIDAQQKGFRMTCARHDLVAQAKALI